jgi:UDP-glucose 4-epimerase
MKYILVTGVAGFIGSSVALRLIKEGYRVVGVDNLSTGKISKIPPEVIFVESDASANSLKQKLDPFKFDSILHIAGQSSAEVSYSDPIYDLKSNVESTLFLLNYAVSKNIKNFVYASSSTVYGTQVNPISLSEEAVPDPISFYAVGKLASERYLELFAKEYGISTVALRLFNVYGPGQNLDNLEQGMASIFLAQGIRDKKILVKGSPDRFRDFVYIDDVVNVFIKALHATEPVSHIYNVSTGIKTSVSEVIEHIKSNLPFEVKVEFKGVTRGDLIGQSGSFDKLKKDFQMSDFVPFEIGIKRMVDWGLSVEND